MPAELYLFIPFLKLKDMKNCENLFNNKKDSTTTIQFLDCKSKEKGNNSLSYRFAAIKKKRQIHWFFFAFFQCPKAFKFGVQFQLDFENILDSASKLKGTKLNTDISLQTLLMNFDNLILNDLLTGLYLFIQSIDSALQTLTVFTTLRHSMWKNLNSFCWKSEWSKSEVKRESRDLCKTKNVIKR